MREGAGAGRVWGGVGWGWGGCRGCGGRDWALLGLGRVMVWGAGRGVGGGVVGEWGGRGVVVGWGEG